MNEISLSKFCEGKTQEQVANELGYSQGWISQTLKNGRDVVIRLHPQGGLSVVERRVLRDVEALSVVAAQ
jgi:transcriptional regulator with XRE-family HTH domain